MFGILFSKTGSMDEMYDSDFYLYDEEFYCGEPAGYEDQDILVYIPDSMGLEDDLWYDTSYLELQSSLGAECVCTCCNDIAENCDSNAIPEIEFQVGRQLFPLINEEHISLEYFPSHGVERAIKRANKFMARPFIDHCQLVWVEPDLGSLCDPTEKCGLCPEDMGHFCGYSVYVEWGVATSKWKMANIAWQSARVDSREGRNVYAPWDGGGN